MCKLDMREVRRIVAEMREADRRAGFQSCLENNSFDTTKRDKYRERLAQERQWANTHEADLLALLADATSQPAGEAVADG